jgi:hypothetical protein
MAVVVKSADFDMASTPFPLTDGVMLIFTRRAPPTSSANCGSGVNKG